MIKKSVFGLVLIASLLLALLSCEDFQEAEPEFLAVDEEAIHIFEDTLVTQLLPVSYADSVMEQMTIDDLFDSLYAGTKIVQASDTVYQLQVPKRVGNSFLIFRAAEQPNAYFYFKGFLNMRLVAANGDSLFAVDDAIPYTAISNYYNVTFNGIIPQIKARYQFEIESGTDYLLKIIGTEQTTSRVFDMVIICE